MGDEDGAAQPYREDAGRQPMPNKLLQRDFARMLSLRLLPTLAGLQSPDGFVQSFRFFLRPDHPFGTPVRHLESAQRQDQVVEALGEFNALECDLSLC